MFTSSVILVGCRSWQDVNQNKLEIGAMEEPAEVGRQIEFTGKHFTR